MKICHLARLFALLLGLSNAHFVTAAGARLVADLNPGAVGSFPSNFTAFGSQVYFSAYTFETGIELFRFDGNSASLAADINPTADDIGFGQFEGNDSLPDWLTVFDGQLYFSAFEPRRGAELWKFDGSQAARVSDINADADDSIKFMPGSSWPRELIVVGNVLYFSATSSTNPYNYELYKFDGAAVQPAANIRPDAGPDHSSYPTGLTPFNGALYFMADDGANGWELFTAHEAGATLLNINPGGPESSSFPKYFTPFNNELYFQAFRSDSGFELWKTDGNTVTLVSDIFAGAESSDPEFFAVFNGALYFRGTDEEHGAELQRFNGTTTTLAADINSAGSSFPKQLTVLGNTLVFTADDGVNGWELWTFDGTSASLVTNLNSTGDAFPENLLVHNGALFFTATTPDTGYEIWKFDGTAITLAADINEGAGDSFPRNLASANGNLFFSAVSDASSNWEPWVLQETSVVNDPPRVTISAPANASTFLTGDTITIIADAADDDAIAQVEFLANGNSIGTDSIFPYSIEAILPAGIHSLTAKATDNLGLATASAVVSITVTAPTEAPVITSVAQSGDDIQISVSSATNATLSLEGSLDFSNWETVATQNSVTETAMFTQPTTGSYRFFRVRVE